MKKLTMLFGLLLPAALLVKGQQARITGIIQQSPDPVIVTTLPIDGILFEGRQQETLVDTATGKYSMVLNISQPGFVKLSNNWHTVLLFVSPGKNYQLNWNKGDFSFSGDEAAAQQQLQQFGLQQDSRVGAAQLDSIHGAAARVTYAQQQLAAKMQALNALKAGAAYTNATSTALRVAMYNELFTNFFFESRKTEQLSAAFKEEYLPVWKSLIPNLPDSSQLTTAPGFSYLAMRYKSLREIADSGRLIFSPGNPQLNSYRYYNHLFKGRMGEYVLASLMVQGIGHHKFEQEWIPVYEDFKAQYPKSPLLPYLQQEVDKVVAFNNAKADAGVKFMPASDTINSIAGLLERLKGKVTYIDLWATWCAPCRAELQFSIAQHHEIAKMGVQQVYLSIDNKSKEEEWKKMAGSLPLKGLNLRSNDTLHKDINRQIPKFVGIPRYIIVDKNGKIVEWDAKRPSDKLELFKQLKQYL